MAPSAPGHLFPLSERGNGKTQQEKCTKTGQGDPGWSTEGSWPDPGFTRIPHPPPEGAVSSAPPAEQFLSPGKWSCDPKEIPLWEKRWQRESSARLQLQEPGMGTRKNHPKCVTGGWGLPLLFPRPLESIREQFGLEIAGREGSRAGQTSNNADVWRLVWDRAPLAPGGAAPGSSGLSSFFISHCAFSKGC